MQSKSLLLSLLSVTLASAHFTLRHPAPLGASASKQNEGPCGGYSVSESSTITDFHVGGEAIAYSSSHPGVKLLLRVVEGEMADGDDLEWSQVFPIVEQYGAGDFCEPHVTAPSSFVGQRGILQVVQNAVDGLLYSCAYVNFVRGSISELPSSCKNGTGVDAQISSDSTLEALMGGGDDEPSETSSETSSAPSSTETPSSGTIQRGSAAACFLGLAVAMIFNTAF